MCTHVEYSSATKPKKVSGFRSGSGYFVAWSFALGLGLGIKFDSTSWVESYTGTGMGPEL